MSNVNINQNAFPTKTAIETPNQDSNFQSKGTDEGNAGEFSYIHTNLYSHEGYLFKSRLCNEYEKLKSFYSTNRKLQTYQQIPSNYFQHSSKFRSLLVYLGTGLGKTVIGLNIMNNLKRIHNNLNIIIMCPAALKDATWKPSINSWMDDKRIANNIIYISLDSPNLVTDFDIAIKSISINSQLLFVIDECHIFTSSLVDETSNRRIVYTQLVNTLRNHNAYLVCLTATPVVNRVEELVYLFNLLRPDTFHSKEDIFLEMFTNSLNGALKNKHIFCKRITGLVSYFESVRKRDLPDTREQIIQIEMTSGQLATYAYAEREEMKSRAGGYKQTTIGMCNFAPPLQVYKQGGYSVASLVENATAEQLYEMSPKFTDIIARIEQSKRTNVVHASFVESTIEPFEQYLKRAGYTEYSETKKNTKSYAIVTGKTRARDRMIILEAFNSNNNMYGQQIKVLVISDAFLMGVTLNFAENIFMLNFHWNMMKKIQGFGRIARLTTHKNLPENERFVNQIIYVCIRTTGGITVDQLLEKTAKQKEQKIDMFLELLKTSAIDFEFNRTNPEFLWKDREPFRVSLAEIQTKRPYMTRSIMDEEGIFKNDINEISIKKINTRQINVAFFDNKQRKHTRKVLLIYPIFNYYIVDVQYYNYIGKLIVKDGRVTFDKDTNFFLAEIYI